MASSFFLVGSMIPRSGKRTIDERTELRHPSMSNTAVLEFRGCKHIVRLINVSSSGAMIAFAHTPNIGERLLIQVVDRRPVQAQVRWVKDGRIGLSFAGPLE